MDNIWKTVECEAWCRGFGYLDYVNLHQQAKQKQRILSEKSYKAICVVFEEMMEDDNVQK